MKTIPYGRQYIDQDDIDAVVEALKSDWLTQGPKISEFESLVANYHSCKYGVAFCNGTAALHGAYYVSTKFSFGKTGKIIKDFTAFTGLKNPDESEYLKFKSQYWEYITTPISFVASANGGLYCGGTPKFVDINMDTYCIDIEKIGDTITDDTRVITPVSYAGYPVDVKAIRNLPRVRENNICIIHDACHAIGAKREGYGIADYADMTVLSFHPVKHITTGEGGMVLTNNKDYYNMLLMFRNHGIIKDENFLAEQASGRWYYEMQQLGYNYRITDIQCALGISQMKKLAGFLRKRNQIAEIYDNELSKLDWVKIPPSLDKSWLNEINSLEHVKNLHSYHLYPIILDSSVDRLNFYNYMKENLIGIQIHYIPIPIHPYYTNNVEYKKPFNSIYSNSLSLYDRVISLPIFYNIDEEQLYRVINSIKRYQTK